MDVLPALTDVMDTMTSFSFGQSIRPHLEQAMSIMVVRNELKGACWRFPESDLQCVSHEQD
jgi:hypothetical protein